VASLPDVVAELARVVHSKQITDTSHLKWSTDEANGWGDVDVFGAVRVMSRYNHFLVRGCWLKRQRRVLIERSTVIGIIIDDAEADSASWDLIMMLGFADWTEHKTK
jgi:hypothetical protein